MHPPVFHRMFGYRLSALPNQRLIDLEDGVSSIEEARKASGATIGYPGWGLLYHLLLCHLDRGRTETIIETGTNHGCTTIVLAQALRDSGGDGKVVSIELDPKNVNVARDNLSKASLVDYVQIIEGDTRTQLPRLLRTLERPVRFAFLDASHLLNDVMFEFETILPHLSSDAIVAFDNTYAIGEENEDQRVNGALKLITERFGGNLINLEFVSWYTPGLAIWQKQPQLERR